MHIYVTGYVGRYVCTYEYVLRPLFFFRIFFQILLTYFSVQIGIWNIYWISKYFKSLTVLWSLDWINNFYKNINAEVYKNYAAVKGIWKMRIIPCALFNRSLIMFVFAALIQYNYISPGLGAAAVHRPAKFCDGRHTLYITVL